MPKYDEEPFSGQHRGVAEGNRRFEDTDFFVGIAETGLWNGA